MTMSRSEVNLEVRIKRNDSESYRNSIAVAENGHCKKISDILTDRLGFEDVSPRTGSEICRHHSMPCLFERMAEESIEDCVSTFSDVAPCSLKRNLGSRCQNSIPTIFERMTVESLQDRDGLCELDARSALSSGSNSPTRTLPTLPERFSDDSISDRLDFSIALHKISSTGSLSSLASLPEKMEIESQVPSSPARISIVKDSRISNMYTVIELEDEE
eukprot:CAMPEP_0113302266 /NCGR_PEP_ID=MMETSP0010_2-20120614/3148_1 /TAXON_ID=216773 ORGANISM="Corethron hystrix, Strain 308" /NCGR_SAMPLE_ID=MMETSP0010_2 /ASSEMBLY_ACC=CAM_ASM_000155 /LENGTH=216 /DNA_ID=CAMNT_0000156023 /DNA_START=43 /DNA_END=693 /DNA_ORIENTATION=+ /assembly_acc=CAM_ASM_000155